MSDRTMNLTLKIWRQSGPAEQGRLVTYQLDGVSEHQSFLEMMDVLNEKGVRFVPRSGKVRDVVKELQE